MIFRHLHIENFKQYEDLQLDFREGLAGIIGRNGSGKSTIFEAILLCLFGSSNSQKEFYRSSWVAPDKHVLLELLFELNTKTYRVRREFRGKSLTHQAGLYDSNDRLIASSASAVSQEVAHLIGMDRETFTRSIFSGQKELGILSETKGEQRKLMVRKMTGLNNLDRIQQLIRDDRNIQRRMIQGQQALLLPKEELKQLEKEIKTLEKSLLREGKTLEKLEAGMQKKETAYQKLKAVFNQLNEQYRQHSELGNEQSKYEAGLEHLGNQLVELSQKLKDLNALKASLKQRQPAIKSYLKEKERLQKLDQKKQQFELRNTLNEKLQFADNQLGEIVNLILPLKGVKKEGLAVKAALDQLQRQLAELKSEQITLEDQQRQQSKEQGALRSKIEERRQLVSTILQLGNEAPCPTCLQPLTSTYEATLQRLQTEIEQYQKAELAALKKEQQKLMAQAKRLEKQLAKAEKEIAKKQARRAVLLEQFEGLKKLEKRRQEQEKIQAEIRAAIQKLGKVDFDLSAYQQLGNQLQAFEAEYLDYVQKESRLSEIPDLKARLKSLKERIAKGKAILKSTVKARKALKFSEAKYDASKQKMDQQEAEKDQAAQAFNSQKERIQLAERQLLTLQSTLQEQDRIRQEVASGRKDFRELEQLDGLFSSFKTYILDRVKPTIAAHASHLFQQITKGRYEGIKVDEDFEFHIFENGHYYPIQRFSGGEIDLANLCLRIGISKALAELSGSSGALHFLGFDEIFGSQDEERRFEILSAFDLLKEQYRQIYIVSHIDTVKEYFPSILEIRKTASGSQATWLK